MSKANVNIYNFNALLHYVREYITSVDTQPILSKGKTEEEYRQLKARKESIGYYLEQCAFGDLKAKEFVKLYMKQLITGAYKEPGILLDGYPEDYKVSEENIHLFIDLENTELIEERFKILLYHCMKDKGLEALAYLVEQYGFNSLRVDEYGDEKFYINNEDIVCAYHMEKPILDYELILEILVQKIYETYKGLGVIDDLLDMDKIDEISLGVSGIPNEMAYKANQQISALPKAYDAIWIRYKGNPIHLQFLSFGSWEELERINKLIVKYEQPTEFSQKKGFLLGFRKNGSRITAAREPFGECRVAWIRNFHIENVSLQELIKGYRQPIQGWEMVFNMIKLLMKGCATTVVSGGQGLGKSTALLAMIEHVYSFYSLRLIETVFELQARQRYPGRDIFTMQATEYLDETDAYNFSLRTSGDVIFIGETRDDKMIAQIVNVGNRGGKFTVFSFHPNEPDLCPMEMANAMLRLKMYSNLKEALTAVLKTLKCCIQLSKNMETGDRYYSIYEFVPLEITIPDTFKSLNGPDAMKAFTETCLAYFQKTSSDQVYTTKPIIEYDYERKQYLLKNRISETLYRHLYQNMQKEQDRVDLRKVFRPVSFIQDVLKENQRSNSMENIQKTIHEYGLFPGMDPVEYSLRAYQNIKDGIPL